MPERNNNGVAATQWKKWPEVSRSTFNELYAFMVGNQAHCKHHEGPYLHEKHWRTLCFNAAFMAADHLRLRYKGDLYLTCHPEGVE
jgi:hypothetical protein